MGRVAVALAVAASLVSASVRARADDAARVGAMPVSWSERPLTLPALAFAIDATGAAFFDHNDGAGYGTLDGFAGLGAGLGVTDDVEIDASIVPLYFDQVVEGRGPTGDIKVLYGNPSLTVTGRLLHLAPVEGGARLDVSIPVDESRMFVGTESVPLLVHLGRIGRLDLEPSFGVSVRVTKPGIDYPPGLVPYDPPPRVNAEIELPLRLAFNPVPWLFLGMRHGIDVPRLHEEPHGPIQVVFPLGWYAGATIPYEDTPIADLSMSFVFRELLIVADGGARRETDAYTITWNASFYLYPGCE